MTAAYLGPPRRRPQPDTRKPGAVEALSASERSHRRRLVREARAAVLIADDPVQRLITRRELAEELDEPAHHDSPAPEAREAIARLVGKRRRSAVEKPPVVDPPSPAPVPLPAEVVVPDPTPLPEPPVPTNTEPSRPQLAIPDADDIAALARARRAEVAAAAESASEATADEAVSDVARLLSRRNGA